MKTHKELTPKICKEINEAIKAGKVAELNLDDGKNTATWNIDSIRQQNYSHEEELYQTGIVGELGGRRVPGNIIVNVTIK